jgi:poly-gamma-glutamate synthesis protein (capsule biosynthesis protein)
MQTNDSQLIRVFLCGDVMTGRGIDQVLPHPGDPVLYESYVRDARDYVRFAEDASGPILRPVNFDHVWGDALAELERWATDVRIVNLETSITTSDACWPDKGVHYRMHPANIPCLTAAGIDCCCLANNHVMDWGYQGLAETLQTLDEAGIAHAGAGLDADQAAAPAVIDVAGKGRILVFAAGSTTSGIPLMWRATANSRGIYLLKDLSVETAGHLAEQVRAVKRSGDVVVVSIHWGSNWGHAIPDEQVHFAHRLVEEGIDIVHGHSSHHVKALEVYRGRLILFGCGDFLTDYEGISGHEAFRGDLAVMYLAEMNSRQGRLVELRLVPLRSKRFRLGRVSAQDMTWLCDLLNRVSAPFATQVEMEGDNSLTVRWQ